MSKKTKEILRPIFFLPSIKNLLFIICFEILHYKNQNDHFEKKKKEKNERT